jgi:hypothetical protein
MVLDRRIADRFFQVLLEEIRGHRPEYLSQPFTVAEIYQSLVPYRSHRDRIGVELNGDYEEALLLLLGSESGYLVLDSEPAAARIRKELQTKNPNTGIFREFAAVSVRIAPGRAGDAMESAPQELLGFAAAPAEEADEEGEEPAEAPRAEEPASAPAPPPEEPAARPKSPTAAEGAPGACPECSLPLPGREGLRYCPHCGTNVHVTSCGACGEELERSWAFCVACGARAGA